MYGFIFCTRTIFKYLFITNKVDWISHAKIEKKLHITNNDKKKSKNQRKKYHK